jgi:O-glycosyl hydrolase
MTDQFDDRIEEAFDIDLSDVVLDQEAVMSWVQMIAQNGLDPEKMLPLARAKYDPDTKDLFLSVPVKGGENGKSGDLVFVLQNELWKLNTEGRILQ